MPLLTAGRALTLAMEAPDAVSKGKGYKRQQQMARTKKIDAPNLPGGAPPMRKVSATQALRFYLQKQAGKAPPGMSEVLKGMGLAAGIGGTALAGRGLAKGVGSVYQRFAANRMFEEIKRRYPEIRRKPKEAREAFDIAIAYAPSLMKHPAAIGDFVRRQLQFPISSHEYLKQLADLEGSVSKAESYGAPAQFGSAIGGAHGAIGMYSQD